jgi:hypothetical protein
MNCIYLTVLLLTTQIFVTICHAKTNIQLQDISARSSPVGISGNLIFNDERSQAARYSYQVNGYLANKSNKDVLLVVVHFSSSGTGGTPLDFTLRKDYFFGRPVLASDESEEISSSVIKLGQVAINGQVVEHSKNIDTHPAATGEITFVQFLDGTTWGDATLEPVRQAFAERSQTARELNRLEDVLVERGEQVLREEISKGEILLPCIHLLATNCNGKRDSCLAEGVRAMIENAQQHQVHLRLESSALIDPLR